MYDELVKELRHIDEFATETNRPTSGIFREAADAIESMSEAYDKLSRHMDDLAALMPRWIPVTERLPELHDAEYLDEVTGELIRYKESKPIMIWLEKGGFMDIGVYEKSDAVDDFCYQGVPATVTYWQPLPEPPKEELAWTGLKVEDTRFKKGYNRYKFKGHWADAPTVIPAEEGET